jgi:putative membrane protein
MKNSSERFEVRPTADSHFGWLRTRLNLENTMMSWLRTAVSLIGFGFAIVQFLDRLRQSDSSVGHPRAPELLGLALIFCGVLALLISIWQYRWMVRYLQSGSFAAIAALHEGAKLQSPIIAVAFLLIFVGLFAFFAVLLRLP